MPIAIGSLAPNFELKGVANGELATCRLLDYRATSAVVLLFVPAAFTGVCTKEYCEVTGSLPDYESLGARVFGISVDTPYALKVWAEQASIGITLLSDLSRTVIRDYDVQLDNLYGIGGPVAQRAAFVIDREGVVQYAEQCPTLQDVPDFDAIRQCLRDLES